MVIVRFLTIATAIYLMYISYQKYKKGDSFTEEEEKNYRGKAIACDLVVIAGVIVQIIGSIMAL